MFFFVHLNREFLKSHENSHKICSGYFEWRFSTGQEEVKVNKNATSQPSPKKNIVNVLDTRTKGTVSCETNKKSQTGRHI